MRTPSRFLIGIAIAVVSLIAAALFWNRAFPTAALQFNITESGAKDQSRLFLKKVGLDPASYLSAAQFGEDTEMKYYIEKEYGVPMMEKKVREGVNLWYWTTRFFKPKQEEEFSVAYDPQGRLVGFFHTIPEDRAAPLLSRDEARVLAENFLRQYVTHHPLAKLKLVEDSSRKRPNRTDYFFTWEQDDLRLGDAPYQIFVTVQGDRVGHFNECVKVPEAWSRQFSSQRSLNQLFYRFASYAELPLSIGAVVLFILYARQRRLRWLTAVPLRWLALFALVELGSVLNAIPDVLSGYQTTDRWGSFIFKQIGSGALGILTSLLGMYFLSLIADAIYRERLPDKLPFSQALGRHSLFQEETVRALGVGIVLACFGLGYVCTFYVIATKLGAWSPIEINYSKIIGGPIPWIDGMQVGMSAAWNEEFTFRVLGILLYWKLFRNRFKWAGIIVAGMTWAFLHSTYPQMPGYLRGCELTVEGVLWGALMTRYGIVATLTGHYLYDCWLSSLVIFQSADPLLKIGAVAVSLWPVALWLIGLRHVRLGHRAPQFLEELLPAPEEAAHTPTNSSLWNFRPVTLTWPQRVMAFITLGLVLTAVNFGNYPDDPMDDFGDIALSQTQIAHASDQILRARGQNPAQFHRLITLDSSPVQEDEYLLDYGTPDDVADLFDQEWPDLVWHVRYFRFMQKEEFNLSLDKNGHLVNWRHAIPREAPGATLTRSQALAIARKQLSDGYGVDLQHEELVEDDVTQQAHRRDYLFTFERTGWDWGESKLRTSITVQGNEPVGFSHYVKVPEKWSREQEEKTGGWKDAILDQISDWSTLAVGLVLIAAFVFMVRRHLIPWRAGFIIALIPAALPILEKLNDAPWFFRGYNTTKPLSHFLWSKLSGDVVSVIYGWLSQGLQLSVALGLVAWAFGWKLERLHRPRLDWPTLRRTLPDFLAVLALSLAVIWSTDYFKDWVTFYTAENPSMSVDYPSVNDAIPWLATFINALQSGYSQVLHFAFIISIAVIVYRRWPWLVWSALALYPFYSSIHEDTLREYFRSVALGEFHWLLTAYLIWKLWRFDVSMIFLVAALPELLDAISLFYEKGGPAYQSQAWPLIASTLILVFFAWWLRPAPKLEEPVLQTPSPVE